MNERTKVIEFTTKPHFCVVHCTINTINTRLLTYTVEVVNEYKYEVK